MGRPTPVRRGWGGSRRAAGSSTRSRWSARPTTISSSRFSSPASTATICRGDGTRGSPPRRCLRMRRTAPGSAAAARGGRVRTELGVVLLTGHELRHRYAASRLAAAMRLVGMVSETKAPAVVAPPESSDDREVLERHFAERDAAEARLLGREGTFPDGARIEIPSGTINAPEVCAWVEQRRPDYVVLFGTGIVRPPLL